MVYICVFCVAVAVLFVGWCLFGLLLMPVFQSNMVTLCFAEGDGALLEQSVRAFHWLRDSRGSTLLIVDRGLSKEGLELAQLLCRKYPGVELCPGPALLEHLSILQDTI